MFSIRKIPFQLGLRKIEASVNKLLEEGHVLVGFTYVPAADGPGVFIAAFLEDDSITVRQEVPIEQAPAEIRDMAGQLEDAAAQQVDKTTNGHVETLGEGEIIPTSPAAQE